MKTELATFAGGCFWCTEAVFQRVKGVISVSPGYSGGWKENPSWSEVCTGTTGHAESIQITFDPKVISYETLVEIFFKLHDPTSLNQQGADVGIEYRSAIFYHDQSQKKTAEQIKDKLEQSGTYLNKIVTEITPFTTFYQAEEYFRNYYEKNSYQPYCQIVIDPKIQKLYKNFSQSLKEEFKH